MNMLQWFLKGGVGMDKEKKNTETVNESFNLFIEKLASIIIDTLQEESKANGNCLNPA